MARRPPLAAGIAWVALGCMTDPPDDVDHLRIVAVRAEPPTPAPQQPVMLELLHSDLVSPPPGDTPTPVQVAWLGGCHNPPGGRHIDCYDHAREAVRLYADPVYDTPATVLTDHAGTLGLGTSFELVAPEASGAFGVSYVFFAICRGALTPAPDIEDNVPLRCLGPGGAQLGRADFEVGFATIPIVTGAVGNQNPVIETLLVNGSPLGPAACITDADCSPLGDPPVTQQCLALDGSALQCHPVLDACTETPCPSILVQPQLGAESAEPNLLAAAPGETPPLERLTAELLTPWSKHDRTFTWQASGWDPVPEFGFRLSPDADGDSVRIWFVVRDNRGGVTWSSWPFGVRAAP